MPCWPLLWFIGTGVFHSEYGPHYHSPVVSSRTSRLFPFLSYCDWSSNEHRWTSVCGVRCQFLGHSLRSIAGSCGRFMFFEDSPRWFSEWLQSHQQWMRVLLSLRLPPICASFSVGLWCPDWDQMKSQTCLICLPIIVKDSGCFLNE